LQKNSQNASDEENLIAGVLSLDWIEVVPAKNLELISVLRNNHNLDRGEAEAIASLAIGNALALELNAGELLIDERLGRREATRLGLPITGVLGILLVAKQLMKIARYLCQSLFPQRLEVVSTHLREVFFAESIH